MTIKVTEQHIKEGTPAQCDSCPIALAFREQGMKADVSKTFVRIWNLISFEDFMLPDSAQEFINKFDNDQLVEPFEFEI